MNKLSDKFWESVNPAYACINELVVIPEIGDCGFMEYFEKKAQSVIGHKEIYSIVDNQSTLLLEFPEPDCAVKNAFELFFESPSVVAQNQKFEGLFGIDISNYVKNLEHDRFVSLLSYINSNPEIVFVLFFYSDDKKDIERVYKTLMQYTDIVKTELPAPTPAQLLAYTLEGMNKLCGKTGKGVKSFLSDFFSENAVGYDSADHLLRHLKLASFDGSLKELLDMMSVLNVTVAGGDKYTGIGF